MRIYNKILSMAPLRIQISLNGYKLTMAGFPSVRLPAFLAFKLIRDVLTALSISLRVSFRVLEFKDVYDYAMLFLYLLQDNSKGNTRILVKTPSLSNRKKSWSNPYES